MIGYKITALNTVYDEVKIIIKFAFKRSVHAISKGINDTASATTVVRVANGHLKG